MSNCNTCVSVNPIPGCIDTDEFLVGGITFPEFTDQTLTASFKDEATGRVTYIQFDVDNTGEIELDIAELYPLSDHPYSVKFLTSEGVPANFILTNPDTTTAEGCCIDFSALPELMGSDDFFLSSQGCAVEPSPSPSSSCENCPSDDVFNALNAGDSPSAGNPFATESYVAEQIAQIPTPTDCDNCPTDDMYDAMENAAGADAANPFATENYVNNQIAGAIVVGSGYFMPENFNNDETLGDGTLRTLASLSYDDAEAASIWTRVAADPRFTIDTTTQSIDWIAWQEACLAMEQVGFAKIVNPGGRGYCPNQSVLMPRDQAAVNAARRSQIFVFDWSASAFSNKTGVTFPMFSKEPENQTDANGFRLSYSYKGFNARFYGNDSNDPDDCLIKIGGTSSSKFTDIVATECGQAAWLLFCLQAELHNINVGSFGAYGISVTDGDWSGATENNSQCNNFQSSGFHSYTGAGKTPTAHIYCQGNRGNYILKPVFEGGNGADHLVLYNQLNGVDPATTVKNAMRIIDADIESAGAAVSGFHVHGGDVQFILDGFNTQNTSSNMPVLVCSEFVSISNHLSILNAPSDYTPDWKFKQIGGRSKWICKNVRLITNTIFDDAANWDTSGGGLIPDNANQFRFEQAL